MDVENGKGENVRPKSYLSATRCASLSSRKRTKLRAGDVYCGLEGLKCPKEKLK
jgi:hypothetical protein